MSDILERLRACPGIQSGDPECCCEEAAAEIEQLRAENAEQKTEMQKLYDNWVRVLDLVG